MGGLIKSAEIDINKLTKDLERAKQRIVEGIVQGEKDAQNYMKEVMQFYIQKSVYDVYNPKVYERTDNLKNNVTCEIDESTMTMYIFVDSDGMDKTQDGVPYPYRVLEGNEVHPYEFPVKGAAFMSGRDWVTMTRQEFLSHMNQSKIFTEIVIKAVNRKLKGI